MFLIDGLFTCESVNILRRGQYIYKDVQLTEQVGIFPAKSVFSKAELSLDSNELRLFRKENIVGIYHVSITTEAEGVS